MPGFGRRTFLAQAACSSAILASPCSALSSGEEGVGARLLSKHFSLHFPTVGVRSNEKNECVAATRLIR